jgi:hypothetical protein
MVRVVDNTDDPLDGLENGHLGIDLPSGHDTHSDADKSGRGPAANNIGNGCPVGPLFGGDKDGCGTLKGDRDTANDCHGSSGTNLVVAYRIVSAYNVRAHGKQAQRQRIVAFGNVLAERKRIVIPLDGRANAHKQEGQQGDSDQLGAMPNRALVNLLHVVGARNLVCSSTLVYANALLFNKICTLIYV